MNSPPHFDIYAAPRQVTDLSECHFYHASEIPGYGLVAGDWDLRPGVDAYLGHTDVAGKRVLELGTADGYLTFEMERRGAEVVSHDLSPADSWDVVPFASMPDWRNRANQADWVLQDNFGEAIARLNNAYWLAHRAFGSRARLVHGKVYSLPVEIGPVDVAMFGAILLHTREPFRALEAVAALTRETIIVTEYPGRLYIPGVLRKVRAMLPSRLIRPAMRFTPDPRTCAGPDGWWRLSPEIVEAFLGVLGFGRTEVTHHHQMHKGERRKMFTVVGHRTAAFA